MRTEPMRQKTNGMEEEGTRGVRIPGANPEESYASYPPAHLIYCGANLQLRQVHSKTSQQAGNSRSAFPDDLGK